MSFPPSSSSSGDAARRTFLRRAWHGAAVALLALAVCALPHSAAAQSSDLLAQFEDRVTTFTLENGLTFVVVERDEAPVVSFHTYADVGAINEPDGQTGIAHMFEHMAFKGTTSLGSTDIQQEMAALERQEEIYLQLRRERAKGRQADSSRIATLQEEFTAAQEEAQSYIEDGAYDEILKRQGVGNDLNAYTSSEATGYLYSLPANKLELFFALESDRFANPVLREFYTERDVVMEERRQRTESNPVGRLIEEFLTTAFKAHPYGEPTIGHMSDLENISRTEAKAFYDKYYVASNLTIGISGAVDPEQVREYAEEYFSILPDKEPPLPVTTKEPEQIGERRVVIREQSQPFLVMGYHRGSMMHEDAAAYSVLSDVLSAGRTSRLYKALVDANLAQQVQIIDAFPGEKDPTLMMMYAIPNRGVSPDSLESVITSELERVKNEGVTQEELDRAKTRARASFVRGLDSRMGLARQFSRMQALTGDWRNVFRRQEAVQNVTLDDVQRVAGEIFQQSNRTVALIKTTESQPTASSTDGGSSASSQ